MGINSKHKKETDLQVGPTSEGMVRLFIQNQEISLPIDFNPDDAIEIANEIIASANTAKVNKK